MPLAKRWSVFNVENIDREYDTYGCYELADLRGEIVYIGQGRIRQRLMAHWREIGDKPRINYYRCIYCGSKYRAEQMERVELEVYVDQYGQLPRYNRMGWLSP